MNTVRKLGNSISIEFLSKSKINLNEYYKSNKNKIAKCLAWTLGSEDGIPLVKEGLEIGFSELYPDPSVPPEGEIKVPYNVLTQTGYKEGDIINYLTMFLEMKEPSTLQIYFTKPNYRKQPKKIWRELEDALRGIKDFENDY